MIFLGKMWMHEHFNLKEAPDLVTYSKKMLAGGIYHKVMHITVLLHNGVFCNGCVTKQCFQLAVVRHPLHPTTRPLKNSFNG
jgi:hypothetical protein